MNHPDHRDHRDAHLPDDLRRLRRENNAALLALRTHHDRFSPGPMRPTLVALLTHEGVFCDHMFHSREDMPIWC